MVGKKRQQVPEGMRTAFRKWDKSAVAGCRVFPLTEVLEALEQ